ncbi:MAG: hypothetical protein VCD00_13655 [Candidatus Hydrogenedentota bacterium]
MSNKKVWIFLSIMSLMFAGFANATDKKFSEITVNPNQVVVQVYGIV